MRVHYHLTFFTAGSFSRPWTRLNQAAYAGQLNVSRQGPSALHGHIILHSKARQWRSLKERHQSAVSINQLNLFLVECQHCFSFNGKQGICLPERVEVTLWAFGSLLRAACLQFFDLAFYSFDITGLIWTHTASA